MANESENRVVVVGAGIIGLCCAVYLQRQGFRVSVIDPDGPGENTSFGAAGNLGGNAHYAIPGVVFKLPGMLLDPRHPLSVHWSHMNRLLPWFRGYLDCTRPERTGPIAKAGGALGDGQFDAYEDLLGKGGAPELLTKHGRLFVWSTESGYKKDEYGLEFRRQRGIALESLSGDGVRDMEPAVGPIAVRGVYAPDAGHLLNPLRVVQTLAALCVAKGGEIRREKALSFAFDAEGRPIIITDAGRHETDQVVLAAGIWSRDLAAGLGTQVPLVAERGYHVMMPDAGVAMRISVLWQERKMIVTPMERGIRASGMAEFSAGVDKPRWRLAERVGRFAKQLIPGLDDTGKSRWMGARPVTPDYLPVIGRSPRHRRVIFAFGHGHSGFNIGPGTGRLIGDIAAERAPCLDVAPYSPDRF